MTDDKTGRQWRIKVYLQGVGEFKGKYISAFLECNTTADDEEEKYEIFLLKKTRKEEPFYKHGVQQFKSGSSWGRRAFLPIKSVFREGSEYLSVSQTSLTFGASIFY